MNIIIVMRKELNVQMFGQLERNKISIKSSYCMKRRRNEFFEKEKNSSREVAAPRSNNLSCPVVKIPFQKFPNWILMTACLA